MSAKALIARLDRVKQHGRDRWTALCPAHNDRRPSLAVTETPEGVTLLKCWSGCSAQEVVSAVGMYLVDLFPPRTDHGPKVRRPFTASKLLEVIDRESIIAFLITADEVLPGRADSADLDRLAVARERLAQVLNYV